METIIEYMKKYDWLILLIVIVLLYIIAFFCLKFFSYSSNLDWTGNTGTLGDTFGGLLSPLIGFVSVFFIYKTFKAQREQLEDQKKQFNASRITDILYLQIQRIDQAIENQIFYPQAGTIKVEGITGMHGITEELEEVFDSKQLSEEMGLDLTNENVDHYMTIIKSNLKQLIHVYGVILNSLKIIDGSIQRSYLTQEEGDEFKGLLMMNLGDTITLNRLKLLFLLNDAQNLSNYEWQERRLYEILSEIEKYYTVD